MGMEIKGLDGYKATVEPLFVAFPDVKNTTEEIIAEGDLVGDPLERQGDASRPVHGHPGDRQAGPPDGDDHRPIAGGKRLEGWGVPDMLGLMASWARARARRAAPRGHGGRAGRGRQG